MIFSTVTQLCIQLQNTSIALRWDFKLSLQQSLHPASSGVGPTPPLIAPPAPPPRQPHRPHQVRASQTQTAARPGSPLCAVPPNPCAAANPPGSWPRGAGARINANSLTTSPLLLPGVHPKPHRLQSKTRFFFFKLQIKCEAVGVSGGPVLGEGGRYTEKGSQWKTLLLFQGPFGRHLCLYLF